MSDSYRPDKTDRKILESLLKDSRMSFQELARELIVSGGTVHVRMNKMKEAGVVSGSKLIVDFEKLGLEVCSFIGINLVSAADYPSALAKLNAFPEVVEAYYTTGQYSMFIKVMCRSTRELHLFLIEKLQSLTEIQSTDTLISLDNPIHRDPEIPVYDED